MYQASGSGVTKSSSTKNRYAKNTKRKVARYGRKHKKLDRFEIYGNAGKQLVSDVIMLKNLVNSEFKYKDRKVAFNAGVSPTPILLNGISEGTTDQNRIGNKTRMKSVAINAIVKINDIMPEAFTTTVRCILFIYKKAEGTPVIQDVLDQGVSNYVNGHRNLDNRKDIIILKDTKCVLNKRSSVPALYFDYYREMDMKTVYNDTNDETIDSIEFNSLYFLAFSESASNTPTCDLFSRIRYVDN